MTLSNATPANNFANFINCHASFATSSTTSSSSTYSVGIFNNPDSYSTQLTLPVNSNEELKAYLLGNTFTYTAGGLLRRPTTDTLDCTIEFEFNIHIKG